MSKVINIKDVKDTKLYKTLLELKDDSTAELVACIPSICEEACDRIKLLPRYFSEYTLHDSTHFIRVTEIMSMILGNTIKELNSLEITLLILSAFYHDQGMIIDNLEYGELEKKEDFILFRNNWYIENPNYKEIENQLNSELNSKEENIRLSSLLYQLDSTILTDYLRDYHGKNSHDFIINNFSSDKRFIVSGHNICNLLANICYSHVKPIEWICPANNFNYDENIGLNKINTSFLAYILRLADILDFDSDRTPEVLYKSIHFTSPISLSEWKKHKEVIGWEISEKQIRYSMLFKHPVYEKTARNFIDWIDMELTQVNLAIRNFPSEFNKYRIKIPEKVDRSRLLPKDNLYVYHDIEFSLSRNEIVKLLLTDNLYRNSFLFIRELLQNSLDALRLKKALYKNEGLDIKQGAIKFRHYLNENNEEIIECSDNGCGMDESILKNYFSKVGRSYYRSPEFDRKRIHFKQNNVDFEPCSQFGIGFMSCFMIGDRFEILTRRDYGPHNSKGKPLKIEINGLGGLLIIKKGDANQETGTTVKIYSRKKPIFYDKRSDNIQLIQVLKGYALATEFPIQATCEIPEIKGSLKIPQRIDKKYTFLEKMNVQNYITIEKSFNSINKNLFGYVRQSFLIDDYGLPCIENNESEWLIATDNKTWKNQPTNKLFFQTKKDKASFEYEHSIRENASICVDGILVCGEPGRSKYSRDETYMLGMIASQVNSEHVFTIDVRGNIKPELSPSREPVKNISIFNIPVGWKQLQEFVSIASGMIWNEIIKYLEKGLAPETFWKLFLTYEGVPFNISSSLLYKYLKIPIVAEDKWISINEIDQFYMKGKNLLVKKTSKEFLVDFPDDIKQYGSARINKIDYQYWFSGLLISLSNAVFNRSSNYYKLRNNYLSNEIPLNSFMKLDLNSVILIKFDNLSHNYVMAFNNPRLANKENPIIKLALDTVFKRERNTLEEFAHSFITVIHNLINDQNKNKKEFEFNTKLRSVKYISKLYKNIIWDKYDGKFKPPYKIYIDSSNTFEITDELLN